jgi:hypothetical protein
MDNTPDFNTGILGEWSQTQETDTEHGTGVETFLPDGTKKCCVIVNTANKEPKVINARCSWSISKNILTEVVTDIDKAFSKKFGIKKGFKTRSFINHMDENTLIVTNLDPRYKTKERTHFYRVVKQ